MSQQRMRKKRNGMSKKGLNIDDPHMVDSFLAVIHGAQTSSRLPEQSGHPGSDLSPTATAFEPDTANNGLQGKENLETSRRSQFVTTCSVQEAIPPPSSRYTGAVVYHPTVASLERVEEDGSDVLRTIADSSNLNLQDSRHAPNSHNGSRIPLASSRYATPPARQIPVTPFRKSSAPVGDDKLMDPANKKVENEKLITQYQDEVVAKFLREKSNGKRTVLTMEDTDTASTIPELTDKVTQSTVATPETINAAIGGTTMIIRPPSKNGEVDGDVGEEDREHLQHFQSWGAPAPRHSPTARVRKVILSNLPAGSDLTLVQSLVYGGAIETFHLSPSKNSAFVTFVAADACDTFFDAYPNGLVFKNPKTCRNHVVYVDKGQDVDVVSGILQAYLDCQASRVVRVTGADEDWGMRALYKLAESKNRKVETIVDKYRDRTRTIIFRFTNIADAVSFRGELLRSDDWEMCNIQFMDDPVARATGVHLEE